MSSYKTRAHLSQLCVSATLRPCVISEERKDAMTQGRKDWKPQNPSESGNCDIPIRIVIRPRTHLYRGYDKQIMQKIKQSQKT